jgi:hypothetical protein
MIALMETRDAQYLRLWEENSVTANRILAVRRAVFGKESLSPVAVQEETVIFDPCGGLVHYPVQVEVVQFGNMPASAFAGWRLACRPKWSLAGSLQGAVARPPKSDTDLAGQKRVDIGLTALIVVQWVLVGGLPLTNTRRLWNEPGSLITSYTVVAVLALFRPTEGLAQLPALIAAFAWLWWIGLVMWKGIRLSVRSLVRLRPSAT